MPVALDPAVAERELRGQAGLDLGELRVNRDERIGITGGRGIRGGRERCRARGLALAELDVQLLECAARARDQRPPAELARRDNLRLRVGDQGLRAVERQRGLGLALERVEPLLDRGAPCHVMRRWRRCPERRRIAARVEIRQGERGRALDTLAVGVDERGDRRAHT